MTAGRPWCLFLVLGLMGLMGCGRSGPPPEAEGPPPADNLGKIFGAYREHNIKNGRPPQNVAELRNALRDKGNVDAILRSPRDGEPYIIIYNVNLVGGIPNPTAPLIIAYEKSGKAGERYVLTDTGPRVMTEAEFAQAKIPPGHQQGK